MVRTYGPGTGNPTAIDRLAWLLAWHDTNRARWPNHEAIETASFIASVRELLAEVDADARQVAMRDPAFAARVTAVEQVAA